MLAQYSQNSFIVEMSTDRYPEENHLLYPSLSCPALALLVIRKRYSEAFIAEIENGRL